MSRLKTIGNPYVGRARNLIGTPYKHLGRSRSGMDCLGLMLHVYDERESEYKDLTTELMDLAAYYGERKWSFDKRRDAHRKACILLRTAVAKRSVEVSINRVKPGDMFLMRYKTNKIKDPDIGDHIAIYAGDGNIVHADIREGVIEVPLTPALVRRIVAVFRKN